MKPRALDLFCGAGGVARGLQMAGFDVTGVDIKPQPRYVGDLFIRGDALRPPVRLADFDLVWSSPPCQRYTCLRSVFDASKYEDLIEPTRALLAPHALTVIENVPGAPIRSDIVLCAAAFNLRSYRRVRGRATALLGTWRKMMDELNDAEKRCLQDFRRAIPDILSGTDWSVGPPPDGKAFRFPSKYAPYSKPPHSIQWIIEDVEHEYQDLRR